VLVVLVVIILLQQQMPSNLLALWTLMRKFKAVLFWASSVIELVHLNPYLSMVF